MSAQASHDTQDSRCKYWTGDRAGFDLKARCQACSAAPLPSLPGSAAKRALLYRIGFAVFLTVTAMFGIAQVLR